MVLICTSHLLSIPKNSSSSSLYVSTNTGFSWCHFVVLLLLSRSPGLWHQHQHCCNPFISFCNETRYVSINIKNRTGLEVLITCITLDSFTLPCSSHHFLSFLFIHAMILIKYQICVYNVPVMISISSYNRLCYSENPFCCSKDSYHYIYFTYHMRI
jgi:hypothetical protein